MSSVREYLLSGYSKRMSLALIEDKQAWIAELLQSQRAGIWKRMSVSRCSS